MNPEPLPNYLRMHRRRTPLSQDDIAFLLGSFHGVRVSRHETAQRLPPVEVALAYEFIFGVPAREIYKGLTRKIEDDVLRRANKLLESMQHRFRDKDHEKKVQTLKHIIESIEEKKKLREPRYENQKELAARHAERQKTPDYREFARRLDIALMDIKVRHDCLTAADLEFAAEYPASLDPVMQAHLAGCAECQRDLKFITKGPNVAGLPVAMMAAMKEESGQ